MQPGLDRIRERLTEKQFGTRAKQISSKEEPEAR